MRPQKKRTKKDFTTSIEAPEDVMEPLHFSQAFNIKLEEKELDFFDLNLKFDSPVFIDPFLVKKSPLKTESLLFERFGDFFRFAYDKSLLLGKDPGRAQELSELLNFREPQEIAMGYTEFSHAGAGPGPSFAKILFNFFVHNSAKRLIREEGLFPDGQFNPITLQIFIDDLGPDGLSDITANIIMDYLVSYTQEQCGILGVPTKLLPLAQEGFDFDAMEWKGGGYVKLPENPLKEGTPVILVPKRFLRALHNSGESIASKLKGILSGDPALTSRFFSFLEKNVTDIKIEDIRSIFLEDEMIFKKYLKELTSEKRSAYDFAKDLLGLYAIKKYSHFFDEYKLGGTISNCRELLEKTHEFISLFKDYCSVADGWKDMWADSKGREASDPQPEAVFGRIFRGQGHAYFKHFKEVTFESEVGSGNGPVDFKIIFGDCRIVIELKRLMNGSGKGKPPLPSYLHGLQRQLPQYAYLTNANHAIYITGQHYTSRNRPENNHDDRVKEIEELLPDVETQMREAREDFESLSYFNIDLSPKPSASNA